MTEDGGQSVIEIESDGACELERAFEFLFLRGGESFGCFAAAFFEKLENEIGAGAGFGARNPGVKSGDGSVFLAKLEFGALGGLAEQFGNELFGGDFVFLGPDRTGEARLAVEVASKKRFCARAGFLDGGGFIHQQRWPTGVFETEHELRLHYLCCGAWADFLFPHVDALSSARTLLPLKSVRPEKS